MSSSNGIRPEHKKILTEIVRWKFELSDERRDQAQDESLRIFIKGHLRLASRERIHVYNGDVEVLVSGVRINPNSFLTNLYEEYGIDFIKQTRYDT